MPDKTEDAKRLAEFFRHSWERTGQFQHLTLEPIVLDRCEGRAYQECYVVQLVFLPVEKAT